MLSKTFALGFLFLLMATEASVVASLGYRTGG